MLDIRFRQGAALVALSLSAPMALYAQAPAMSRQAGTVTAVDGNAVTIKTAAGAVVVVTVAPDAKVVQVPPGAKDLSAATPATVGDVSVGDKVLANGTAPDASKLTAVRVIVMKSTDINAMHASEEREWQRGLGGLVKTVDGNTVTVASGAKTLTIHTTPETVFKRYADDSVDFANAQASSLAAIHPGDQLRARGTVADDRLSMIAKEVVTGSFENLSGLISAVDSAAGTLTLKDLATKKTVTVAVTAKSDLRNLPAEAAARFAARSAGAGAAGAGGSGAGAGARPAGAGAGAGPGAASGAGGAYSGRRAGFDLSQMLSRLPTETLADLKPGQAVMIVASQDGNSHPTAITLLSGVEAILSATPAGQQPITLSPWNLGSDPEAGGAGGEGAGGPR
jgi:co-chaperonin GroES (HSP10)